MCKNYNVTTTESVNIDPKNIFVRKYLLFEVRSSYQLLYTGNIYSCLYVQYQIVRTIMERVISRNFEVS